MGVVISGGFAGGKELADGMVHRAGDDGPMPSFLHGVQGRFDDFDLGWHWYPVAGQSEWGRALRFFPDVKRRIERVFDKINASGGGVIELPQEFAKTFWRETGVKVEAQLGSGEVFQAGGFRGHVRSAFHFDDAGVVFAVAVTRGDGEVDELASSEATGGGIQFTADAQAFDHAGEAAFGEDGELAVERQVAEFGPWVEAAVALADFDESAFVFPARRDGIQWVFGAQRVTMDEDRFVKVQHGKSGGRGSGRGMELESGSGGYFQ